MVMFVAEAVGIRPSALVAEEAAQMSVVVAAARNLLCLPAAAVAEQEAQIHLSVPVAMEAVGTHLSALVAAAAA